MCVCQGKPVREGVVAVLSLPHNKLGPIHLSVPYCP